MRTADRACLVLLVLDGIVVGVLSAAFAYARIGGQPIPVAAIAAGIANAILVWLAAGLTDGGRGRSAPLLAWLATILILSVPGPGGDVVVSTGGTEFLATLMLLVIGAGIPAALLWSGRLDHRPDPASQ